MDFSKEASLCRPKDTRYLIRGMMKKAKPAVTSNLEFPEINSFFPIARLDKGIRFPDTSGEDIPRQ